MDYVIEILLTELHRIRGVIRQIQANEHLSCSAIPHLNYVQNEYALTVAIERLKNSELAATDSQQTNGDGSLNG